MKKQIASSHGIVFVSDPTNREAIVPEYEEGKLLSQTTSCLSVAVQPYVDGDVELYLFANTEPSIPTLPKRFEVNVATPGKKIAIHTPEEKSVLETPVLSESTLVEVSVDDDESPSCVTVRVVR